MFINKLNSNFALLVDTLVVRVLDSKEIVVFKSYLVTLSLHVKAFVVSNLNEHTGQIIIQIISMEELLERSFRIVS